MLERQLPKPRRHARIEKLTLAVVAVKLKTISNRSAAGLRDSLKLFQPETVLKWHREMVRRSWTYRTSKPRGDLPRARRLRFWSSGSHERTPIGAMAKSSASWAKWAIPVVCENSICRDSDRITPLVECFWE